MMIILLGIFLNVSVGAPLQSIEGQLLERGTRTPLSGVSVFLNWEGNTRPPLKAVTEIGGQFKFNELPEALPEKIQWIVNAAGYERLDQSESVQTPVTLYLEKVRYQIYETTVYGKGKRDDTSRGLKAADVIQIPGSGNDPLKALQNLPGVNRPQPFQSQVLIQGSAPQDTRYQIDGHEVPIIFHFGGLTSVVPPEALDRVEYLSAGYGPDYGRAIGGRVGAWTRAPRNDRLHGTAFVDVFNSGLFFEGPVGEKSSFLVGARKSYIGEVLKAVLPEDEDFNLTVAPSFSDLTAIYETELGPNDHFRWANIGSLDTLEFLFKVPFDQDPSLRGDFYSKTAFFRLIPQYEHRFDSRWVGRLSMGLGRDWIRFDASNDFFNLSNFAVSERAEVEGQILKDGPSQWTSTWGIDNEHRWTEVNLRLRDFYTAGGVPNPYSVGQYRSLTVESAESELALFWKNEWQPSATGPLTLLPNIRMESYTSTDETFILPRMGARYRLDPTLQLRTSGGLYTQPPRPQELNATIGNPNLDSPRAWHLSVGAEKDFREGSSRGFRLEGGLFYKWLQKLVVQSGTTSNYSNDGVGKAYGLEGLLKLDLSPWSGWLSYTLSRSTRQLPGQGVYPFEYDQTHLVTLIGARELPSNWRIGGRFRYATGNPYTPIDSAFYNANDDVYVPVRGGYFSKRLTPFYQLDIRVDKRWIYDTWILSLYLDIQNITNHRSIEDLQYSYDYSSSARIEGLPILPTLGLKGEF